MTGTLILDAVGSKTQIRSRSASMVLMDEASEHVPSPYVWRPHGRSSRSQARSSAAGMASTGGAAPNRRTAWIRIIRYHSTVRGDAPSAALAAQKKSAAAPDSDRENAPRIKRNYWWAKRVSLPIPKTEGVCCPFWATRVQM
ncbi:MAG: hypothetical protein M3R57_00350 [Chloroflexota bacterium]|nr:hypothetical protein [Chloroflexota bacterium]